MAPENAIYNKAAECLKVFNDCIESMTSIPWPQDQLDRFNLWAAHGGIFGSYQQHTSMDWRLRERPELVEMILQLLILLHEYLSAICTLTSPSVGRAIAAVEDTSCQTQSPSSRTSPSASSSECSFGLVPETSSVVTDPIDTARGKVEQTLSELFRISAAIRSAGMSYRYSKAANFIEWQGDVNLTQKFREGVELLLRYKKPSPSDYMVKRLIETVCLRQRELAYSRKRVGRSEKEESVKSHSVVSLPPRSTAGYSRQGGSGSNTSKIARTATGAFRGKIAQHDTVQSTVYTATYVPTMVFPQTKAVKTLMTLPQWATIDDSVTNLPLPPEVGERLEFECPYCGIPLEREIFLGAVWRNHVLEDLRPYVCILPDCKTPHALYKSSDSWISHMRTKHKVTKWKCVSSCQSIIRTFQTEAEFLIHAKNEHKEEFTTEEMLELANIGRHEIDRELGVDILLECPICTISFDDKDFLAVYSHIAEDLTEYAWISLPESPHADANVSQKASSKSASVDDGRIGQRRESEIETERMFPWSLWDSDDPETRSDLAGHDADLKPVSDPSDADVAVLHEILSDIRNIRRRRLLQEPDPSQNLLREYEDKPNPNEGESEDILLEDPAKPLKFDLFYRHQVHVNPPVYSVFDSGKSGHTVDVERLLWVDGYERSSLESESKISRQEMTLAVFKIVLAPHSPDLKFSYVEATLGFENTDFRQGHGLAEPKVEAWAPFHSTSGWTYLRLNEENKFSIGGKPDFYGTVLSGDWATEGRVAWDRTIIDKGRSVAKTGPHGVTWVFEQNDSEDVDIRREFRVAVLISRASPEPYLFRFGVDTTVCTSEDLKHTTKQFLGVDPNRSKPILVTPWKSWVCNYEGNNIIKGIDVNNLGRLRGRDNSSVLDLKLDPDHKVDILKPLQKTSEIQEEREEELPELEDISEKLSPKLSKFTKEYCNLVQGLTNKESGAYRPTRVAIIHIGMRDISSNTDNLRDLAPNRQQSDARHLEKTYERFGKTPDDRTLWSLLSRIKEDQSFVGDGNHASQWSLASDLHGIQMARIIGSIDPCCDLYIARVSSARSEPTSAAVTMAIRWAIMKDVDIISISFALREKTEELENACSRAVSCGVAMICSADDEGTDLTHAYPADFLDTIAIAAYDKFGTVSPRNRKPNYDFAVNIPLGIIPAVNVPLLNPAVYPHKHVSDSSVATAIAAGLSSLSLSCNRLARRGLENDDQWRWNRIVSYYLRIMTLKSPIKYKVVQPANFPGIYLKVYTQDGRDIDIEAILRRFFSVNVY